MKKILSMLAIISAVLVSCTKETNENGGDHESTYLNVYYNDIVFPSNGGEDYFDIESNTDWTISNTSDWLKIKPTKGNGNASITLTASASDVYDDRNTVITVRAGDKTKTFTITQKYVEALLVTKNKFDIPQDGGSFTIEVQSSISYDIIIAEDCRSWITEAPSSKALNSYTHIFAVENNPNATKRDGHIEIIGDNGKTETVNIYQAQKDELVLSHQKEIIPAKGGEVRVQLRSNVDYEVIIPEDVDWVEQIQSNKEDELVFNVKPNDKTEEREAHITVKDKNSDLSQIFTIKQIVGSIILEESYFEVDAKGGSIEVNLSTDIDFEVIIPENIDWVTRIETKSLEKRTFNLNVLPNSQTEEREAEITVKDVNSDVAQTLTIKQRVGKIIVEQNEFKVQFRGETISIPYSSDIECDVIIPESAQSWISVVDTKSMESHSVQLSIAMNEGKNERTAMVTIQDINSPLSQKIEITQMAFGYYKGDIEATSEEALREIRDSSYTIIDGDVYLNVKTLSQLGNLIEEIRGNLKIGAYVTTLDGLYGLKHIGGDFIERSDKLVSFEGLNNLKTIGGSFDTDGVSFNSLKSLESIGNDFTVSNVEDFTGLEHLTTIGGILHIEQVGSCEGLNSIQSIQGLSTYGLGTFTGLNNLHSILGDLSVENGRMSDFTGLNNLREIGGNFELSGDNSLELLVDNSIYGGFNNLKNFEGLSQLQTIGGDFILSAATNTSNVTTHVFISGSFRLLESFKGLENLTSINGDFVIQATADGEGYMPVEHYSVDALDALLSFEGLSNLYSIGGDFIIKAESTFDDRYSTTGRALSKLQSFSGMDNLTMIGGDFYISANDRMGGYSLTELSFSVGFEKLKTINGDFTIESEDKWTLPNITPLDAFKSLETINGNLSIENIDSFSGLDNLRTIAGDFVITSGDTQGMSNLATIGGNLTVRGETSSINGLTGLNTINGNLSISRTSMMAINGLTQLQKVGGDIEISDNSELEDISGFSGLTNCANISITYSPNLYDFQPLETAAKNMTGTWYVYGCGYNPTKYQMLNGESKPQE